MRVVREGNNSRSGRELAGVVVPQGLHRKTRNAIARARRGTGRATVKRRPPRRANPPVAAGAPGAKAKEDARKAKLPRLDVVHHPGESGRQIPLPRLAMLRSRIKRPAPNRKAGSQRGRRGAAGVRVRGVVPGQRSRL
tara:strand:- start:176 stop:589 length:414 start_codon:yes stop_codon:yes gene_type:complete